MRVSRAAVVSVLSPLALIACASAPPSPPAASTAEATFVRHGRELGALDAPTAAAAPVGRGPLVAQTLPFPIPTAIPTAIPGMPPIGLPVMPGTGKSLTSKIVSVKAEGDLKMSGGVGVDAGGSLILTMPAIRHPDFPNTPVNPLLVAASVSANVSGGAALSCSIGQVSATSRAPVDLVFINDTTGSMSGSVLGIADSIQKFAEEMTASGVDARFSMYNYGDAFATKSWRTKGFLLGQGDFEPPSFDEVIRPYIGLTDLGTFKGFLTEMRGSGVLGTGGGDAPENPLGALWYAYNRVQWRPGAARVFILTGDNPSHQAGDGTSWPAPWTAVPGDEVVGSLDGNAVVHTVVKDLVFGKYYNLKNISDGTGGVWKPLPADGRVDLGSLGFRDWFANSFRGQCSGVAAGTIEVVIRASVIGKRLYSGALTFKLSVSAGAGIGVAG
jgi:hypothetical protein